MPTGKKGRGAKSAQEIENAVYAQRKGLADLMHSSAMRRGDRAKAFKQITETAASVLGVERSSVWDLVDGGRAIECVDLFERSENRHSAGTRISATDVPRYFAALKTERSISANDACTDPRTSEFRSGYLEPNRITAMLDAPIFVRGKMVGVVCNEHVGGPRTWDFSEELLAGTFADFVALVQETVEWRRSQDSLRVERDALESKVNERTEELRQSEANLRTMLDFSPVSMVLTRATDHKVVYANRRAGAMFEVPIEELINQNAPDYWVDMGDRQRFLDGLQRDGSVDDLEVQLRASSGRAFWTRMFAQRIVYRGEVTLLGAMVDITDQRRVQQKLRELAIHDALTGVYNRRYVDEVVSREMERAERYQRPLTVAMVDADNFKRINDQFGHQVGDEVLRVLSRRCQKTLRSNDVLGRYGGEEFVVIFPETGLSEASGVAERVRAAVANSPVTVGDRKLEVTISIGLASLDPGQDPVHLLEHADHALYAAKQSGRNRVQAFAQQ